NDCARPASNARLVVPSAAAGAAQPGARGGRSARLGHGPGVERCLGRRDAALAGRHLEPRRFGGAPLRRAGVPRLRVAASLERGPPERQRTGGISSCPAGRRRHRLARLALAKCSVSPPLCTVPRDVALIITAVPPGPDTAY